MLAYSTEPISGALGTKISDVRAPRYLKSSTGHITKQMVISCSIKIQYSWHALHNDNFWCRVEGVWFKVEGMSGEGLCMRHGSAHMRWGEGGGRRRGGFYHIRLHFGHGRNCCFWVNSSKLHLQLHSGVTFFLTKLTDLRDK